MKNKIEDLRNHLFEVIEMLKDGDESNTGMTIEKAKTICQVSDKIVDTVKVEIDYLRVAQDISTGMGTGFIPNVTKELGQ